MSSFSKPKSMYRNIPEAFVTSTGSNFLIVFSPMLIRNDAFPSYLLQNPKVRKTNENLIWSDNGALNTSHKDYIFTDHFAECDANTNLESKEFSVVRKNPVLINNSYDGKKCCRQGQKS